MKILIAAGIAAFAALLVFAWFYESAVQHINLLISAVGFIILPLLIWQFGSVKADEKRANSNREITLNLVLLDIEYLFDNLLNLREQLERILDDFVRFKNTYPKLSSEKAALDEFNLILASTRTLPEFKYEFGFTKKDLQVFSQDDFKMFDLIFQLCNLVKELNESIESSNENFKNALAEVDKQYPQDDGIYERYAFVNNSYRGIFEDQLVIVKKALPKIDEEILPAMLEYSKKNFEREVFGFYEKVARRMREKFEG